MIDYDQEEGDVQYTPTFGATPILKDSSDETFGDTVMIL